MPVRMKLLLYSICHYFNGFTIELNDLVNESSVM